MTSLVELSGEARGRVILDAIRAGCETAAAVDDACATLHGWTPCGQDEWQAAQAELAAAPIDHAELIRLAGAAVAAARTEVTVTTARVQALRTKMAAAINEWCQGRPVQSRQEAAMDVIRTHQATRATLAQSPYTSRPGPSKYDRQRFYSGPAGGTADDYVAANMRNGGNRRGGHPLRYARGPVDVSGKSRMPLPKTNSGNNRMG